jgi:glycine cleavage system H protein
VTHPRVDTVYYHKSRFATHLPVDRRYTASHYWLREDPPGIWTIGFTRFATRMLGDIVECVLTPPAGTGVTIGEEIGAVEGFKAVTALFSVAEGEFLGANDALETDITRVESDPHGRGWLYRVRGIAEPASLDVHGYVAVLDDTIVRMLAGRHEEPIDDPR